METSRTLICGLNWIGDSIMAMPALHAFAMQSPSSVTVLAKPGLAPLWAMMPGVDGVEILSPGSVGTLSTGLRLRHETFQEAYVLPNSFRSALVPFLAGIPRRIGRAVQQRGSLLNERRPSSDDEQRYHQAWEYVGLLLPSYDEPELPPLPTLKPDVAAKAEVMEQLGEGEGPWVGLVPGAARGPAKRWPPEHFAAVGRRAAEETGCRVVVMGASGERDLCREVAAGVGSAAIDLAGKTTLPGWASVLEICDVVIANDSGGMHLASAMGTPVVAIYGQTDSKKTGPLGPAVVLQRSDVRDRRIARDSESARLSLASVQPNEVYEAARQWLAGGAGGPKGG